MLVQHVALLFCRRVWQHVRMSLIDSATFSPEAYRWKSSDFCLYFYLFPKGEVISLSFSE